MTDEVLAEYLDALRVAPLRAFKTWTKHKPDVPTTAWGVYTVWATTDAR
jgi:hypothetical protein